MPAALPVGFYTVMITYCCFYTLYLVLNRTADMKMMHNRDIEYNKQVFVQVFQIHY